jgi:hypothetical protein
MQEVIQHRPFIQPVDAIDHLLAIQEPRHPRVLSKSHLPTQPLGPILCGLVPCLSPAPPPSAESLSAIAENGPQIKAVGYVGISAKQPISS